MAIKVEGGKPLIGTIRAAGAKNAALPILAATLLAKGPCLIERVPDLDDVRTMLTLLAHLGLRIQERGRGTVYIEPASDGRLNDDTPFELATRMRASFLVTGPLLARLGRVRAHLPGGCAIGSRPIDLHLKGMMALGASATLAQGALVIAGGPLRGAGIYLDVPSVTATENLMMAATLARGETVIHNAAREPEVVDLARFLNAMGAHVSGAGTAHIIIAGQRPLAGAAHRVMFDRIEAATYLLAGTLPGSSITVRDVVAEPLRPVLAKLQEAGVAVQVDESSITVSSWRPMTAVDLRTMPHPGFPTDVQPPFSAALTLAKGTSIVTETIFEQRFLHVPELKRMGAAIRCEGSAAIIRGVDRLTGTQVRATDLRAGAALVLAGLAAQGVTEIHDAFHLWRGYEDLIGKFRSLGAVIDVVRGIANPPTVGRRLL